MCQRKMAADSRMGDTAASALPTSISATGLSTLEEPFRTFRRATEHGETVSLYSKNGEPFPPRDRRTPGARRFGSLFKKKRVYLVSILSKYGSLLGLFFLPVGLFSKLATLL
jgi:hypothetical protein